MTGADPRGVAEELDHLFRRRAGQMVATLTRLFGLAELDRVEDAVQEALLKALALWPYRGTPRNPTAWLIQVARNTLLDDLRRRGRWRERVPAIERRLRRLEERSEVEAAFAGEVFDDQLRMIFTCCHPAIPRDGQVALTPAALGKRSAFPTPPTGPATTELCNPCPGAETHGGRPLQFPARSTTVLHRCARPCAPASPPSAAGGRRRRGEGQALQVALRQPPRQGRSEGTARRRA